MTTASPGFTYITLLIFVAVIGASLAATGPVFHLQAQRERERQLLFVGAEFRRAIAAYYEKSPGGDKRYPQNLSDLLLDKRYPATRRYLRRIYLDPMTNSADWGIVNGPGQTIVGVYSKSQDRPVKRKGFPPAFASFKESEHYSDWKFAYVPSQSSSGSQDAGASSPRRDKPGEGMH